MWKLQTFLSQLCSCHSWRLRSRPSEQRPTDGHHWHWNAIVIDASMQSLHDFLVTHAVITQPLQHQQSLTKPSHCTSRLPVQRWVEFKIACLVHQLLASLAPTYLPTDIHLVSEFGRRPLRSSTDRTRPRTHNWFGDRGFAVAGPRLWNSLLKNLRQISSYKQFRRYLKNHLFVFWEITAQCDVWFSALYKYSYLLTYLQSNQ